MKKSKTAPSSLRKYRFWYHYNKHHDKLTVHYRGECLLTDAVDIKVPTNSKYNKKSQPHYVIQGWTTKLVHTPQLTTII